MEQPPSSFRVNAALAIVLGFLFVISGLMHADDTRGSAQPSPAYFAKGNQPQGSDLHTDNGTTAGSLGGG